MASPLPKNRKIIYARHEDLGLVVRMAQLGGYYQVLRDVFEWQREGDERPQSRIVDVDSETIKWAISPLAFREAGRLRAVGRDVLNACLSGCGAAP